jgi:hypothetical protein
MKLLLLVIPKSVGNDSNPIISFYFITSIFKNFVRSLESTDAI